MHEFEPFETQKFVGRLLGRGDWGGFIDKVKDVIPEVGPSAAALLAACYFLLLHQDAASCGIKLLRQRSLLLPLVCT